MQNFKSESELRQAAIARIDAGRAKMDAEREHEAAINKRRDELLAEIRATQAAAQVLAGEKAVLIAAEKLIKEHLANEQKAA